MEFLNGEEGARRETAGGRWQGDGDPSELVEVARFHYRHEAEIARGFLEHAGIPSLLNIDDAGGAEVGLSFGIPARLRVRREHLAEAIEVLTDAGVLDEDG